MAISGSVSASINITDSRSVGVTTGGQTQKLTGAASWQNAFGSGAGALQGNVLYAATRTLSGASEDVDLSGVLSDLYGSTVTMVRVKAVFIRNNSTANNITVGAASSNQWSTMLNSTGTITLHPGAYFSAATPTAAGWTVTAGTGDILKVAGTSGQSYDVVILGASS